MAGVATVILAAGIVLWAAAPRGPAMAAFGDVSALVLLVAVSTAMLANAVSLRRARAFWALLGFGCLLWTIDNALWTYWEVIRKSDSPPDPFIGDVILFIHVVPFMAAIALRPHRPRKDNKALFDTVNFLTLLGWWVFLYAFVVFPEEYVVLNAPLYSRNYDVLYVLENLVLVWCWGRWLLPPPATGARFTGTCLLLAPSTRLAPK